MSNYDMKNSQNSNVKLYETILEVKEHLKKLKQEIEELSKEQCESGGV